MYRCLKGHVPFNLSHPFTNVQRRYSTKDNLWATFVCRDQTLNFLNNVYCIKVQFYGTILVMNLNEAVISCLLDDCTNRNCNVFYESFMSVFYACNIWAPRKNTLCNWPPRINIF